MAEASSSNNNPLFSEHYKDVLEALELLYIRGNMSARVRFMQERPVLARYIMSEELMEFDTNGASDVERRALLEERAEERRFALVQTLQALEQNSLEDGVLQISYVKNLVESWGREMACLIYAPNVVDKALGVKPSLTPRPVTSIESDHQVGRDDVIDKKAPASSIKVNVEFSPKKTKPPTRESEKLPTPSDMKFSEKLVTDTAHKPDG